MFQPLHSPFVSFGQSGNAVAVMLFVLAIGLPSAQADFTFTHSGTLVPVHDPFNPETFERDVLGVKDASFVFTATFPSTPYEDSEYPTLHATSVSLTFTGASIATTNQTFSYASPADLKLKGNEGVFLDDSGNGSGAFFPVNGGAFSSVNDGVDIDLVTYSYPHEGVNMGYGGGNNQGATNSLPTLANFPTTFLGDFMLIYDGDAVEGYSISNGSISISGDAVTAVPEPSAFLCVGLIALGYARRKRNRIR